MLVEPAAVSACTCPSSAAETAWPKDGATDVPLDTPLVLWRYSNSGVTDIFEYSLTQEDGDQVALAVTEILPPAYEGCGSGAFETVFLTPEQPLEPNASYTFHTGGVPDRRASFTTGDGRFASEPAIDVDLQYLLVQQPDCSGSDCFGLAEIRFDLGERPETPRWIVVESAAARDNHNTTAFYPEATHVGFSWQLSVEVPADDRCIDVRVYGLAGLSLFEERRCEPDRCARHGRLGYSTCGGPPYSGIDVSRIPAGTCDDPPLLEVRDGVGIIYPDGETDDAMEASASSSGCSLGRAQPSVWSIALLLLAAMGLRRPR